MDTETLKALKGSIKKWGDILNNGAKDKGAINCPLCVMFNHYNEEYDGWCVGCPVSEFAQTAGCENTPYDNWLDHQWDAHDNYDDLKYMYGAYGCKCPECTKIAINMIKFLTSLLPKEEV